MTKTASPFAPRPYVRTFLQQFIQYAPTGCPAVIRGNHDNRNLLAQERSQVLTLAEVKHGTGFRRGTRFRVVRP